MFLDDALLAALDGEWRSLRELALHQNTKAVVPAAQRLQRAGLAESRLGKNYNLVYRLTAQGIETRSAIDAKRRGPKGESPVAKRCAQGSSQ